MSLKSSSSRYGKVAIATHWTSVAAVILAFSAGLIAAGTEPAAIGPLIAHIVLGSSVFALTLLRIVWWLAADKRPALPSNQSQLQQLAAKVVHYGLYAILILMGTSGIMTLVLSGAVPMLLAGTVPDFSGLIPRMAHGVMSRILLALLVAHVGAALFHQFVRRDRLLARMGIGRA